MASLSGLSSQMFVTGPLSSLDRRFLAVSMDESDGHYVAMTVDGGPSLTLF